MKSLRSLAASVTCLVALGVLTAGSARVATAEVVFGNLGPTASGPLAATSTDILVSATAAGQVSAIAQGFTTGNDSAFLTLQSVILGLFASGGDPNRTVSLYSNNAGEPGAELAVSSSVAVGAQDKYTFGFSNVPLLANTSYWIVPQSDVSWYVNAGFTNPAVQNGSGYSYLGTASQTFDSGGVWASSGLTSYSVSVQAVPEPSTYALAALGFGVAGIVRARRRNLAV